MRISLIFLALSGFTYSLPNAEPGSMRNWFNSKSNSESKVPRKLAVKIGPSADVLELCNPNDEETPQFIDNDVFTGHVVVRVAGFNGIVKEGTEPISNPVYFNKKKRIYSIQVSGRFKEEFSADDVLFGAEFDNKSIFI